MSKKNIYPHHMGSTGYVAKIPEWKKKIEEGVAAVQGNALQLIEKKRLGLFKSNREKDVLSGPLSNAEHTGCICGIASQMP
jgi:hypothetical protein